MQPDSTITSNREKVAGWILLAFFALVVVGLEPFQVQTFERFQRVASGEGDTLRQVAYLSLFLILLTLFMRECGVNIFKTLPSTMIVVLMWVLISSAWSQDQALSLRRAGLTVLVCLFVFMAIHLNRTDKVIKILKSLFAVVLVLNFISVAILPTGVHLASDFISTAETVGAWRGMHFEKNIAGMIAGMAALLFFHTAIEGRKIADWLLFLGEVAFLVGTKSKTSFFLLLVSLIFSLIYRFALRSVLFRRILTLSLIYALPVSILSLIILKSNIQIMLEDPSIFTNRGYIWHVVFGALPDHLLLGYGFRAFWLFEGSPVSLFAGAPWVLNISHAHNGYLEVLIGTGLIGLILSFWPTIVGPALRLFSFKIPDGPLWLSWLIFFLLLNVTETELFERDRPAWVLFLVCIAVVYKEFGLYKAPLGSRPHRETPRHATT